ncbi:hypothetical protein [Tunturibacter empetritectus]|uniref:Uncharacterized protein n=2 Tax=Tunturiibacter empetritectus TaxID=3069691 RepID=A0A7W8IEN4_9BACT|nr:hypothetical protein [Edaphobacter lichenicola]MBB5315798.1 hypothetical protein [Edaphobacter lichenicola]
MKIKTLTSAVRMLSLFVLVSATCTWAQEREQLHFKGLINDYSPSTVKGGPWEMHGQWAFDIHGESDFADFAADMTMSDYAITAGTPDATAGGQNAHTHHIRLTNVRVIWNMIGCPTFSPATTRGFQITSTVNLITGNGSNALFEPKPPATMLQVCITGGAEVPYSNMTMVFTGPATSHFGPQAIHGVVRKLLADDGGH